LEEKVSTGSISAKAGDDIAVCWPRAEKYRKAAVILKEELSQSFWENIEVIKDKPVIRYSDGEFRSWGIPSPRQYAAFNKLIQMIGEETFKKLPTVPVFLNSDELFFPDMFKNFFPDPRSLKVVFTSGHFWKGPGTQEQRKKMISFLIQELLPVSESVCIYTQDRTLKREVQTALKQKNQFDLYRNSLRFFSVPYRIDIHYIQVEHMVKPGGKEYDPEKSYIFLEYPHTEQFLYRLDTYFSYAAMKYFKSGAEKILHYLEEMRNYHLKKSFYSKIGKVINT
jgi:hypothetical protein